MSYQVLVLNSGSSSIKFCLYDNHGQKLQVLKRGQIAQLGTQTTLVIKDGEHKDRISLNDVVDHASALTYLLDWLQSHIDDSKTLVVGHRVVHGGDQFYSPVRIDADVLSQLKGLEPLAPLHQPYNLLAIEALMQIDQTLIQVACFDTTFHVGQGKPVNQYALPTTYYEQGIRRYGFHGLSYEFILESLEKIEPDLAKGKVIVAHLGNGASLCAIDNGRSVDNTMGFSALEGLMMGTRCGSIDAGVLLYLLEEKNMTSAQLTDLLYRKSGLLGVSGISNDMRQLLQSESANAREAIDLFVYRIVRETGSLITVLQGLDVLVFTGGIGENEAEIRQCVCDGLAWLDISIDDEANQTHQHLVSTLDSAIKVFVIPTDEEWMIATHTITNLQEFHNSETFIAGK